MICSPRKREREEATSDMRAQRLLLCAGQVSTDAGCRPASTLLAVAGFAFSDLPLELEATAAA